MTSRERVLASLHHQEPDKVPVTLAYEHPDDLCAHYGKPQFKGRFRQDLMTVRFLDPPAPPRKPDLPADAKINFWGYATVANDAHDAHQIISPLADVTDPAAVARYPFPDFTAPACHQHLDAEVRRLHDADFAVQGQMSQTIFEISWALCGLDRTLMDLADDSTFIEAVFDRVLELRLFQARRYAQAGVDIVRVGDDVGTQRGMMMSPESWRRLLRPRLARVIAAARSVKTDVFINYHSDGNIEPIIPDLIDVGVDILNPIQPECMDPRKMKSLYGDHLTLLGTIGTQTTFPHGSPLQVREVVRQRIAECGRGGGLILAPTHEIRPDVPWENLVAFYDAVEAGAE